MTSTDVLVVQYRATNRELATIVLGEISKKALLTMPPCNPRQMAIRKYHALRGNIYVYLQGIGLKIAYPCGL